MKKENELYATFEVGRGCAFSTYSKGWRGSRILHFVTCIVIFSVTHAWGGQVRRGIAPQEFRCVVHRRGPFFIGWGPSKIIRYFDCSIVLLNYFLPKICYSKLSITKLYSLKHIIPQSRSPAWSEVFVSKFDFQEFTFLNHAFRLFVVVDDDETKPWKLLNGPKMANYFPQTLTLTADWRLMRHCTLMDWEQTKDFWP